MKPIKTILIIEDSEPLRKVLFEKLKDAGFTVLEAEGGEEGLKIGLEQKPDMIITDLVMYPMTGQAMIAEVRRDAAWGKNVPIIVLTNQNDTEEESRLKPYHLTAYITKADSDLETIVKRIKELAEEKKK